VTGWLEIVAAAALVAGGLFVIVAGVGVVRLPDVFTRLHASTKAGTLGVGLIVAALALTAEGTGTVSKAIGCILFLLATAPVGAHLIGRAAARPHPDLPKTGREPGDGAP
jgi:multicomponent Na+:H+ antiporter subunit G